MKKSERTEALMKLLITIICCFIAYFWGILALILTIFNWLYAILLGMRNKGVAEFLEYYNTFVYTALRYVTGNTNERPFPFAELRPTNKFKAS